jgi:hypothetical protein
MPHYDKIHGDLTLIPPPILPLGPITELNILLILELVRHHWDLVLVKWSQLLPIA